MVEKPGFRILPALLTALLAIVTFTHAASQCPDSNSGNGKPNILFIAIDDMNDWTGFLGGHPQAITPNLDKLASKGMSFNNAHCPAPGCSPSRNALLYGVEPFHSGLYPFYDDGIHEQLMQKYMSLPRFFKENGYSTFGAGKIHHGSKEDPLQWNDYFTGVSGKKIFREGEGYVTGKGSKLSFRPTYHADEEHVDYQVASYGIDVLKREHDQPFFLAIGIVKPHLPFDCPVRFFDALPEHILAPEILEDDLSDIPAVGNGFRRANDDRVFKRDAAWEDVRRAYLACISWADYNIGRVLDELSQGKYGANTIVVVWSDHGFHLGEKMSFRKFTLWEEATRVPFIIYDPREQPAGTGGTCSQPVSLVHIYRTLAEMSGLEPPGYVDGQSLVPQLHDPRTPVKSPAMISWGRGNYAVRTADWRYIRYFDGTEELYDHNRDENEWQNLAENMDYAEVIQEMRRYLPGIEAPLIEDHLAPWSIEGADKERIKKQFQNNQE